MRQHTRGIEGPGEPRTSVIIPSYNYAEFLPAAIESVLAQTDQDFELLIVDDGSTDESVAVACAYADPRVRVLAQRHRGIGAARNQGIRAARGRYIAFLDADDVWVPSKLAAQCDLLERRPDVGLVYGRFGVIDASGRVRSSGRTYLAPKPSGAIIRHLLARNVIGTPSTICLRRHVIQAGSAFDETGAHAEDWHFYLQIASRTRIQYLPRILAYHRQHSRNWNGTISILSAQTRRTAEFALGLARDQLGLTARDLECLRRRLLAYVDALVAREFAKAGDVAVTRRHAARSLVQYPWNVTEALLWLSATAGWVPSVFRRRLK